MFMLPTEQTPCQEQGEHILIGLSKREPLPDLEVEGWKEKLIQATAKRFRGQAKSD